MPSLSKSQDHEVGLLVERSVKVTVSGTLPDGGDALKSAIGSGTLLNVVVTAVSAFIVTEQLPVPLQPPPDQPAKVEFTPGEAVRVTTAPSLYSSVQSDPQFMPAGELVTVPVPVPSLFTVRVYCRIPVPLNPTVERSSSGSLEGILKLPPKPPLEAGANFTVTVQLPVEGTIVAPEQSSVTMLKGEEGLEIIPILWFVGPPFVTVTV